MAGNTSQHNFESAGLMNYLSMSFFALSVYFLSLGLLRWRVRAMYRRIAAEGYPTTMKELDDWYVTPQEGNNAADEIVRAGQAIKEVEAAEKAPFESIESEVISEFTDREIRSGEFSRTIEEFEREFEARKQRALELAAERGIWTETADDFLERSGSRVETQLTAEFHADFERFLTPRRDILERVRQATQKTGCRYPIELAKWPEGSLEHLITVRQLARAFRLDIAFKIAEGDVDDAIQSVETSFRLADTLRAEPTVMSLLVRSAVYTIAIGALNELLTRVYLSDEQLARMEGLAASLQPGEGQRAIAGERCIGRGQFGLGSSEVRLPMVDNLRGNRPRAIGWSWPAIRLRIGQLELNHPWLSWRILYQVPYKFAGLESINELHYMSQLNRFIEYRDPSLARRRDEVLRADILGKWLTPILVHHGTSLLLSTLYVERRETVLKDLVMLAIAIERYRLRANALPENLEDLVPSYIASLPCDPFSGKVFRYERLTKGYTLHAFEPSEAESAVPEQYRSLARRVDFTVAR